MKRKFTEIEDSLFKTLHRKGNPLVLHNIWDVGSAQVVEKSGAKALATSSWAIAKSYGYEDGEKFPFKLALQNLKNIIEKVKLPVNFDFESGFSSKLSELKENVGLVVETGAIGINFEDQIIGREKERYSIEEQCKRIKAIKETIMESLLPSMFINARTDIFLQKNTSEHNEQDLKEAIERSKSYRSWSRWVFCTMVSKS